MPDPMNTSIIDKALRLLGQHLQKTNTDEIEILLVGGAAGMITGILPNNRVTIDCDVMNYTPPDSLAKVELAAEVVAEKLQLAPNWLNSDVQIRSDTLPDDWEQRKVHIAHYGPLRVFAVSRIDLIAMKVIAARDQDIEDLQNLRLRSDDIEFINNYLFQLRDKGTAEEQINDAHTLLESLEITDYE